MTSVERRTPDLLAAPAFATFENPLSVAGQAIHWFITADSIAASSARWWAVAAQAVLGTGVAVWFFLRARNLRREN